MTELLKKMLCKLHFILGYAQAMDAQELLITTILEEIELIEKAIVNYEETTK